MVKITMLALLMLAPLLALSSEQRFISLGQPPQLIELYTSEGCSSCPPADKRIAQLLNSPDLWTKFVPMTFHVDYWDYLGWRDSFAKPQFSLRQRQLKRSGQLKAVYTPGWVVDGQEWRGFFRGLPLPAAVGRVGGQLTADRRGSTLFVSYEPAGVINEPLIAHLSILGFDYETAVEKGENRGLRLPHQFVVLHSQMSEGQVRWQFDLPAEAATNGGRKALAVWVSQRNQGRPLQVLGGWLE
ncbi:MAG: DUF1223 domain-containing protein [Motiliproteus sp.]